MCTFSSLAPKRFNAKVVDSCKSWKVWFALHKYAAANKCENILQKQQQTKNKRKKKEKGSENVDLTARKFSRWVTSWQHSSRATTVCACVAESQALVIGSYACVLWLLVPQQLAVMPNTVSIVEPASGDSMSTSTSLCDSVGDGKVAVSGAWCVMVCGVGDVKVAARGAWCVVRGAWCVVCGGVGGGLVASGGAWWWWRWAVSGGELYQVVIVAMTVVGDGAWQAIVW
jgi:hypothetical protein